MHQDGKQIITGTRCLYLFAFRQVNGSSARRTAVLGVRSVCGQRLTIQLQTAALRAPLSRSTGSTDSAYESDEWISRHSKESS